jgi:ribosome modulation factor
MKGIVEPKMTEERAYRLGYDCGMNGANLTNCNFSIFQLPYWTAAWERGKADGEKVKASLSTKT